MRKEDSLKELDKNYRMYNLSGEYFSDLYNSITDKEKNDMFEKLVSKIISHFFHDEVIEVKDNGCTYDRSGSLEIVAEKHKLENYDTFSDFLQMCNGMTKATYISGHGLHHCTYEDEFSDLLMDMSYDIAKKIVFNSLSLSKEEEECLTDSLFDEYDNDFHDNLVFPIQWEIEEKLEKLKEEPLLKVIRMYHKNHKDSLTKNNFPL